MIRLLENGGAEKFALGRVWARVGAAPAAEKAVTISRSEVEKSFAAPAAEKEREPNDTKEQATAVADGIEVEATIRPGESDLFRLPAAPVKKGRASLQLQLQALPWLRLNGDVLDPAGKPASPPFVRPEAAQTVQQRRSPQPVPAYVQIGMPPSSLSVVLDMSGSMTGREKDLSAAIKAFFEGITPAEQVQVLRFSTDVSELAAFTNDRKKLDPLARKVSMNGATALYKALNRALDDLSNRGGNRAILLLSDGMNTVPGPDFAGLCNRLRAQPVPIYVIGVGWDLYEFDAASGNTCVDLLRNLALITGGKYFFAPTSEQLGDLYKEIADELRGATRYRLSAKWEVLERNVELFVDRGPPAEPKPFTGGPPPAATELASTTFSARPIAHIGALPPAAAELAEVAAPNDVPVVNRLALPSPVELTAISAPKIAAGPGRPSLPAFLELAGSAPPVSFGPMPLNALPEFGRVSVTYAPARDSAPLPPSIRPAIELILDSSGSMKEEMEGAPKYLAARRVMTDLLKVLPDDATVGLRIFGHMAFWNPAKEPMPEATDKRYFTDSEIVVSIGQLTKERRKGIQDWIEYLTPKGATPLCYSLVQASKDFPAQWKGPKTVVLVSDGIETCGGKLEDVEKAYAGKDVSLVIHVVGFDVKEAKEQEYLKSLARIGRGQYFNAASSKQLADSLTRALRSAGFVVRDGKGNVIARGTINGSGVDLEPGAYSLEIPGTAVSPLQVRVAGGKQVPVKLDADGRFVAPNP